MAATFETGTSAVADLAGLRILGFCDHVSSRSCGGAERAAVEVYRRLNAMGAEVRVVTARSGRYRDDVSPDGMSDMIVAPSLDMSRLLGAQVSISPGLYGCAARAVDTFRPHVLHAHSLHFQTTVVAALLQGSRRVPMVTTAHVGGLDALPRALRVATASYERGIGRMILARSTRAIAVSDSVAQHLRALGLADGRIDVIPNGVDHHLFRPGRPTRTFTRSTVPRVLFVGRLISNKGPQVLLRALMLLRSQGVNFQAEIVGEGPLRATLERTIRRHGLTGSVTLTGAAFDVAQRLQTADVVVRPSFTEGMALAVLEAMASGRCVVASDIPANAGLISDGTTGLLFRSGDATDLARILKWTLCNPGIRRKLGAAAHLAALPYSWDAAAMLTGQVLAGVAARRGDG